MKLVDLEPRWIHLNVLAFKCPHCQRDWLTVKNAVFKESELFDLYEAAFGDNWNMQVVPCNASFAWTISGDFQNMTITPSVDASNSGHWHGHISNGEVR